MYESNLDYLKGHFQDKSIQHLKEIFDEANKLKSENTLRELRLELLEVLQQELSIGLIAWEVSPSGNNHIIVTNSLCLLMNIGGATVLFENWLFFEGELRITNIHWIEENNLVIFDVHYIVHDKWEKCICHFAPDDFFVYFAPDSTPKQTVKNNDVCRGEDDFFVIW